MKVLTESEGQEWLASKWCAAFAPGSDASALSFRTCFKTPTDTGRKSAIAFAIARWASQLEEDVVLWITDWSAFPNGSIPALFYGFRKSLGDERLLTDAPFNVFSPTDTDSLAAMQALCLYFYWDSYLVPTNRRVIIGTSNDEFVDVYGETTNSYVQQVFAILDGLGLERFSA